MARIRHIALVTDDPAKTAEFYKQHFGLTELYRRPGFLIRRAQQIAVSLFLEETGALGITNTQYGILLVLKHRPGIDQISVAKLLGLDRSTTGMVLGKLEKAGLIGRCVGEDRRKRNLALTPAGERMLARLGEPGAPKLGPGQTSDMRGIHHIGFYVDDEEATAKSLRDADFSPVPIPKSYGAQEGRMAAMGDAQNLKYLGPDDVQIDIRSRGWNEAISFAMQRYELTPAADEEPK